MPHHLVEWSWALLRLRKSVPIVQQLDHLVSRHTCKPKRVYQATRDLLRMPCVPLASAQNHHRMAQVGKNIKDHRVQNPCHEQEHLPLDWVAQSPFQHGLEQFQGQDLISYCLPASKNHLQPHPTTSTWLCQLQGIANWFVWVWGFPPPFRFVKTFLTSN